MQFTQSPSVNHNDRVFDGTGHDRVKLIILHYTETVDAAEALRLMQDANHKAAAHYLIDTDGSITQLIDDQRRAWHAGKSYWAGSEDINSLSLGIEIQNPGHRGGKPAYPPVQIAAVTALCRHLIGLHNLDPEAILAHSDVAPARKIDPGEWFPWARLAADGLGFWPEVIAEDEAPMLSDDDLRVKLEDIGYDPALPLDTALTAFQRHFVPEAFAGGHDMRLTYARLNACQRHARARGRGLAL